MQELQSDIQFLKGVGPKRAELLNNELNIFTFRDLLYYYPFRYIDRSKFYKVKDIKESLPNIQSKGIISNFKTKGTKYKQVLTAEFSDETGTIELIWFKGIKWVLQNLESGNEYIIFGKPARYGRKINIAHPEIDSPEDAKKKMSSNLQAVYSSTEKLNKKNINSKVFNKILSSVFEKLNTKLPETLPGFLIQKLKLISHHEAIRNIHFPKDNYTLQKAIFRLKFEELFFIQLSVLQIKYNRKIIFKGYEFPKVGDFFNRFFNEKLPFELTGAQKRVIKEIRKDFASGKQSNRLLQGDVGSGKTLVALMLMLIALDNGFQASIMAPTEILAQQHFISINKFLKGLNVSISLLTGSTKQKDRRILHENLQNGNINILIGTHALIEDTVKFHNLGLVVIDEQHRFGVAQRAKMWKKNKRPPHMIVMTATPIPRTLSMTIYGDLDISIIDELPPGRKKIKTIHSYDAKRLPVFKFVRDQIKSGRQIYIVYPLIYESENFEYKDLEDGLESISRAFPPPEYAISVVHGQMKPEEKEASMNLFVKGITNIMIATTVIEVGVDVPNATVMIIESAERFGLSQLHQLRGRVGRGAEQSYCILMTSYKLSKEAKIRINTMVETNDGFKIAEVDMKLRGPGDTEGTRQSGLPFELKLANLTQDYKILELARHSAIDILDDDSELKEDKNQILVRQLKRIKTANQNWGVIS
ncbi:MAG: ATP-dependent DNA helicase RecG [Bacteroidales bacterium]|nr:ATP-dependent DNA helicase RecG [Bacteroidales bacterium]